MEQLMLLITGNGGQSALACDDGLDNRPHMFTEPECHNWCIHTHFYGFSPEVRELYRFLDSSLRCNVPVWIGEGGSAPVDNSIFYEIAATYDIGYALWTWKSAEDPKGEGSGTVRYPLPQGWEPVRQYILNGGPRPSYRESQKIFDEMIENIRLEHCKIFWQNNCYNLRQPGITLPAVGFDQGSGKGNGWLFGNPFGYRTEEGMKLVLRPGVKPPKRVVVPTREQIRPSNPLTDLCLELREGEEVTYTIRDVKESCRIEAAVRNMKKTDSVLLVTMENLQGEREEHTVIIAEEDTKTYELGIVCTGCEWKIKIGRQQGNVQVDEVIFQN